MEYRQLGNSDIQLSSITFGAWAIGGWMWGGADKRDAIAAIQMAVETGMTSIDTAAIYGQGHSESVVGEALQGRRNEVQILTKFGLRWDTDKGLHYFDSTNNQGRPISIHRYAGKAGVIEECEQEPEETENRLHRSLPAPSHRPDHTHRRNNGSTEHSAGTGEDQNGRSFQLHPGRDQASPGSPSHRLQPGCLLHVGTGYRKSTLFPTAGNTRSVSWLTAPCSEAFLPERSNRGMCSRIRITGPTSTTFNQGTMRRS